MRDLHINIGGPRDRARQNVAFHVAQNDQRRTLDVAQITHLVAELRRGLEQSQLAAEDLRRAQRQLATLEEEARSEKPLLSEVNSALSFLANLVQTANGLAPVVGSTFRLLAAALG